MISVLIPVYRVPVPWFREAIESVDAELRRFREMHPMMATSPQVVIVCDGTDDEDVLSEVHSLSRKDGYTLVDLPQNLGVAGALNEGVDACRNELIARFDADDVMLPGRLHAQYERMQRDHEVDVLGTGLDYLVQVQDSWVRVECPDKHPDVVTKDVARSSLWFTNHPTVMYRKSSLKRAGGYDSQLRGFSEDYELWVRMLRMGMRIRNIRDVYHLLRISPSSASKTFNRENHEFLLRTQATL